MPVLRDLSTLVGWKIYSQFCVQFHSCSAYSFQVCFSWFPVKFPLMHTQISSQPKSWGNPFCRSQALSLCSLLSALQIWPFLASLNSVLCRLNSARLLDSLISSSHCCGLESFSRESDEEFWDSPYLFPFSHVPLIVQCLKTNGLIGTTIKLPKLFTLLRNPSTSPSPPNREKKHSLVNPFV